MAKSEEITAADLAQKVQEQAALIRELVGALDGIRQNDATTRYEYHGKRAVRPYDGARPDSGRWLTPREIAERWLRDRRVAPYQK